MGVEEGILEDVVEEDKLEEAVDETLLVVVVVEGTGVVIALGRISPIAFVSFSSNLRAKYLYR